MEHLGGPIELTPETRVRSSPFQHMGFKNRVFIGKLATFFLLFLVATNVMEKKRVI